MISSLALNLLVRRAITSHAFLPELNHYLKVRASYSKSLNRSIVLIEKLVLSYPHASDGPVLIHPVDHGCPAPEALSVHF
jgi:hypothetical protein